MDRNIIQEHYSNTCESVRRKTSDGTKLQANTSQVGFALAKNQKKNRTELAILQQNLMS